MRAVWQLPALPAGKGPADSSAWSSPWELFAKARFTQTPPPPHTQAIEVPIPVPAQGIQELLEWQASLHQYTHTCAHTHIPPPPHTQTIEVPIPVPAQGIQELLDWQAKEEAEDPDEKRKEFYGNAGGEIFGIVSGLLFVRVCVCVLGCAVWAWQEGWGPRCEAQGVVWKRGRRNLGIMSSRTCLSLLHFCSRGLQRAPAARLAPCAIAPRRSRLAAF